MLIFVKITGGPASSVEVDPTDTVKVLREKVLDRIPATKTLNFNLVFAGKALQPDVVLSEIGIKKESTVHVVEVPPIKLRGLYGDNNFEVTIKSNETVRALKTAVALACPGGISGNFDLKFGTTTLSNMNSTVSTFNLANEDVVEVVLRPETSSSSSVNNNNYIVDDIPAAQKEDLLTSFAQGAKSSKVEIVFSFDTTGSMSACIAQVRNKVEETTRRLMKDIPDIRIGIIAHGDYCDPNIIDKIDLTNQVEDICKFIRRNQSTGGGDAPEAYEYALRVANEFSWTEDAAKALVVIGDEVPHVPSFTTLGVNWWDELDTLIDKGVKVYGVRALTAIHSRPFYETLSERSGTVSITFQSFHLMTDMFLAICYRESSPEKLEQFQTEVAATGAMTEEMGNIFTELAKPDHVVASKEERKEEKKSSIVCTDPWYDISKDKGRPQYKFNDKTGVFSLASATDKVASVFTSSSSSSSSSSHSRSRSATSPAASSGGAKGKSCIVM